METTFVQFIECNDFDDDSVYYGILVNDDHVICLCCGTVFDIDEVKIIKTYDVFPCLMGCITEELDDIESFEDEDGDTADDE